MIKINLLEEFDRIENQRNGCELLVEQSKIADLIFSHSDMNDLNILIRFFRFLQQSLVRTRVNAVKLLLRLPGSKLLTFAYEHLKPSPSIDMEEKNLLERFVLILSDVLKSLVELHPFCYDQIDSMGLFDRLEMYTQQHSVRCYSNENKCHHLMSRMMKSIQL